MQLAHETNYLHCTIGNLLTDSVTQYIINNQINHNKSAVDPITSIATYLRQHVDGKKQSAIDKQVKSQLAEYDSQLQIKLQQVHNANITARQKQVDEHTGLLNGLDNVFSADRSYDTYNDLFTSFIPAIQSATGSTSVYIGKVVDNDENKQIRYISTDKSCEYMLTSRLLPDQGITWQLFDNVRGDEEDTVEGESEDELTAQQIKNKADQKPLNQLFVPNIAAYKNSDKIHYFNRSVPSKLSLGCYCVVQLSIDELSHNVCVDDSIQREAELIQELKDDDEQKAADARDAAEQARIDEDDEIEENSDGENDTEETVAEPVEITQTDEEIQIQKQREIDYIVADMKRVPSDYVICFDTLSQNRKYTNQQLQFIQTYCKRLRHFMRLIDLNTFVTERENRRAILSTLEAYESVDDDVKSEAIEKLHEKLMKSQPDAATESDAIYAYHKQYIASKHILDELITYSNHTLLRGDINVLYALLILYRYDKSDINNSFNEPVWNKVRVLLNDELISKFNEYQPRAINEQHRTITAELKQLTDIIDTIDQDELRESNIILYELVQYIDSVVKVKQTLKDELINEREKQREQAEQIRIEEEQAAELLREQEEEEEAQRLGAAADENDEEVDA